MLLAHGPQLGWEGAALPDGGSYYYHLSHSHDKKKTATYRIPDLHGASEAEAEEAEQGFELERHKLMTTEPRCLPQPPSRLCYILAVSLCLPSWVPAGLWE